MPLAKGSKNITLRVGLTPRLQKKHREELRKRPNKTDKTLIGYTNDLLSDVLDKDDFLKMYAPYISVIEVVDNVLYLKDSKLDRTVEIYCKDNKLYCNTDKKFDCKHIHYAFAIPEIARLKLNPPHHHSAMSHPIFNGE